MLVFICGHMWISRPVTFIARVVCFRGFIWYVFIASRKTPVQISVNELVKHLLVTDPARELNMGNAKLIDEILEVCL